MDGGGELIPAENLETALPPKRGGEGRRRLSARPATSLTWIDAGEPRIHKRFRKMTLSRTGCFAVRAGSASVECVHVDGGPVPLVQIKAGQGFVGSQQTPVRWRRRPRRPGTVVDDEQMTARGDGLRRAPKDGLARQGGKKARGNEIEHGPRPKTLQGCWGQILSLCDE